MAVWRSISAAPDDCLAPCIATVLQVHIIDVPDPQIDAQLAAGEDPDAVNEQARSELAAYLARFALRCVFHDRVPLDRPAWIGLSPGAGRFDGHAVVMNGSRIVHDPAEGFPVPAGCSVAPVREISAGLTLDPLEDA